MAPITREVDCRYDVFLRSSIPRSDATNVDGSHSIDGNVRSVCLQEFSVNAGHTAAAICTYPVILTFGCQSHLHLHIVVSAKRQPITLHGVSGRTDNLGGLVQVEGRFLGFVEVVCSIQMLEQSVARTESLMAYRTNVTLICLGLD